MGNKNAEDLIRRGRTRLLSRRPFYGHLACSLKLREDAQLSTMSTDSVHLYYNADFASSLSKPQMEAAIAHEVTHVYLKHVFRMAKITGRDMDYWPLAAIAADMAINPTLKEAGFELIDGAVYPDKEFWNDSLEAHYKRLKKSAKKITVNCTGGCSGVKPMVGENGKIPSPAEVSRLEEELGTRIMNAAKFARAAGKLPADIERLIQELRASKVAWFDVVRRFMQTITKNDYRMLPPNRRYIHAGLYLPSLRSEAVSDVLLIADGSGSTCQVFPQFISEMASVLIDVRPERLHAMVWDTRCTWMKEFDCYSEESHQSLAAMQAEMGAGGGTVFTECFDWFEKQTGTRPNVAIVLTDMELFGEWPADPGYPVIWVATTDIIGPYGETIKIEAQE